MNAAQKIVFLETRLRNLKRRKAKLAQHPSLQDMYFSTDREIRNVEQQLIAISE